MAAKQLKPGASKSGPAPVVTPSKADQQDMISVITAMHEEMKGMKDEMKRMGDNLAFQMTEIAEVKKLLNDQNDSIRKDLVTGYQALADSVDELEVNMTYFDEKQAQRHEQTQGRMNKMEEEMIMERYRRMEFALRLRGLKENKEEDLRQIISELLAPAIGAEPETVRDYIDKVYRVSSWFARQKQLPRDVVVYFSTRRIRNDILQATYQNKIKIDGKDILVLKEVPSQMLKSRKEYAFLVEELKKSQIQFRWEVPFGIVLNYEGKRFRLDTVWKAKDFCLNVLKVGQIPSPKLDQRKEAQAQIETIVEETLTEPVDPFAPLEKREEIKEQRQTRAATKRKEQEMAQRFEKETGKMEAVGGARPKGKISSKLQSKLQMLQGFKDGE